MDQRIERIQSKIDQLSIECTDKHVFARQLPILLNDTHLRNIRVDEVLIIYSYIYNHREYLFELNWTKGIRNLIDKSTFFINRIKEMNKMDPLIQLTLDRLHQARDALLSHLDST